MVVVGIGMIGWEVEAATAAAWTPDPESAWTLFVNCSNSEWGMLSCQSRYQTSNEEGNTAFMMLILFDVHASGRVGNLVFYFGEGDILLYNNFDVIIASIAFLIPSLIAKCYVCQFEQCVCHFEQWQDGIFSLSFMRTRIVP